MHEITNPRHRDIVRLLSEMDAELLRSTNCLFGGGTAISLLLNEYRTSTDVDFLCSSTAGYARLREIVFERGIPGLFKAGAGVVPLREPRCDRDGIRTFLSLDGQTPIKFEIVLEGRVKLSPDLSGESDWLQVPVLSRTSLFAEKLLANADRGLDPTSQFKDIIDLMVMESAWGESTDARQVAEAVYGDTIGKSLAGAMRLLAANEKRMEAIFGGIDLTPFAKDIVLARLAAAGMLPIATGAAPSP